jgi:hypothetical protein
VHFAASSCWLCSVSGSSERHFVFFSHRFWGHTWPIWHASPVFFGERNRRFLSISDTLLLNDNDLKPALCSILVPALLLNPITKKLGPLTAITKIHALHTATLHLAVFLSSTALKATPTLLESFEICTERARLNPQCRLPCPGIATCPLHSTISRRTGVGCDMPPTFQTRGERAMNSRATLMVPSAVW